MAKRLKRESSTILRYSIELRFDMAAAGHAVLDFGTEGTLELRFNVL